MQMDVVFFSSPPSLFPCVCVCFLCVFAVCVCPQRAAGKAWHVALTGLSSINGSALGLNEKGGGGRRDGGDTQTPCAIFGDST